jgi:RimJ/RimL family protein N-acetyltransferase
MLSSAMICPRYVQWLNDPTVLEYFGNLFPLSREQEEKRYEAMIQDSSLCNLAIEFEGRHVGGAGLSSIDHRNQTAEVGPFIGVSELWDQGLGRDITRMLLRFGFEKLNLHRIYLRVLAKNERALYRYERIGFRYEGRWRHGGLRHGRYHDVLWMGIRRDEWSG